MDSILASLPASLLSFVEDQLSNNDVSPDEELLDHFIANGLTDEQARQALTYRDNYSANIYLEGFTPIRKADEALRFNPATRQVQAGLSHSFSTPRGSTCPSGQCCPFPLSKRTSPCLHTPIPSRSTASTNAPT